MPRPIGSALSQTIQPRTVRCRRRRSRSPTLFSLFPFPLFPTPHHYLFTMAFIGAAVAPVALRPVRASVCSSRSVFVGARVAAKVAAPVAVVPTMKYVAFYSFVVPVDIASAGDALPYTLAADPLVLTSQLCFYGSDIVFSNHPPIPTP